MTDPKEEDGSILSSSLSSSWLLQVRTLKVLDDSTEFEINLANVGGSMWHVWQGENCAKGDKGYTPSDAYKFSLATHCPGSRKEDMDVILSRFRKDNGGRTPRTATEMAIAMALVIEIKTFVHAEELDSINIKEFRTYAQENKMFQ